MANSLSNLARWTKVDPTTPVQDVVSSNGGNVAAGTPIAFPNITKTGDATYMGVCVFVAKYAATHGTLAAPTTPAGFTKSGEFVSTSAPANGQWEFLRLRETTPAAAGTIAGPSITLPQDVSSWAVIGFVLKPDVSGGIAAPKQVNYGTSATAQSVTSPVTQTIAGLTVSTTAPQTVTEAIVLDDPSGTVTPPAPGAGDPAFGVGATKPFADGKLLLFSKRVVAADVTAGSFAFAFASGTGTAPTITTAAVIGGAHTPLRAGDPLNIVSNTVYNPQTSAITLYRRRTVKSINGGVDWAVVGAVSEATTQAGLATYSAVQGDAGAQLAYESQAVNDTGPSVWSRSNVLTVQNLPVNDNPPDIAPSAGDPIVGVTLVASGDTYTPGPITANAYSFERSSNGIDGWSIAQTKSSDVDYLTSGADSDKWVRAVAWGTNDAGESAAGTPSDPVFVAAVFDPSIHIRVHHAGGAGNSNPNADIGGGQGAIDAGGVSSMFGPIVFEEATAGGHEYRLRYLENIHPYTDWTGVAVYIPVQYPVDSLLTLRVGSAGNGVVASLPNGQTAPSGVVFSLASTYAAAPTLPDVPAASADLVGIWFDLAIGAGAPKTDTNTFRHAQYTIEGN